MAIWARELCGEIERSYGGSAENIWNDEPRVGDIYRRFLGFKGIGQKKASMAANILVRDFRIKVTGGWESVDVSLDRHVKRVFLRTGLAKDETEVIRIARELNPEYPGILDLPAWQIGRTWCKYVPSICDGS